MTEFTTSKADALIADPKRLMLSFSALTRTLLDELTPAQIAEMRAVMVQVADLAEDRAGPDGRQAMTDAIDLLDELRPPQPSGKPSLRVVPDGAA